MRWRRIEGLDSVGPGAAREVARLGGLEGFARSVMVGVIPLTALQALGSKAAVSYVFFGGALITLAFTLNVGWLEARIQRRWVLSLGSVMLVCAAAMFAFVGGPFFAVAVGLRSGSASLFSVCMSLYVMDFIGKRELTSSESTRLLYAGFAWLLGPSIGVWLFDHGHPDTPFLISGVASACMLTYFWRLRIHRNPVLLGPVTTVTHPFHNIVRFFGQRSLRIAYAITTTRAMFWAAVFIYGPIYVIEADLPTWVAGSFLSATSAMLFLSPLVGRLADRIGTRQVIIAALLLIAVSMCALAAVGAPRPAGLAFWMLGAVGGAALDVVGNIPFMRMVKPRERTAMTTVFSTWREASFLLTPLVAAIALAIGDFRILYITLAVVVTGGAAAASFLPRRL